MRRWAVLVLVAACDHRPPALTDCGGDLRGVWRDQHGRRHDVIATERGWEMFPMFDDRPTELPDGVAAAPSMIALGRDGRGTITRRYERGKRFCNVATRALLHTCRGHEAVLDVRVPTVPDDFATCAIPETGPGERWLLVRE